jgi:hypothetical protein
MTVHQGNIASRKVSQPDDNALSGDMLWKKVIKGTVSQDLKTKAVFFIRADASQNYFCVVSCIFYFIDKLNFNSRKIL